MKNKLIKKIALREKEMTGDCWEYHKDILQKHTSRKELADYLDDMDLQDWEDVSWMAGYISGLKEAREIITEQKTK